MRALRLSCLGFTLLAACGTSLDIPRPVQGAPLAAPGCENMSPGCGDDPLPAAGCYVRCTTDSDCAAGQGCVERTMNPCAGSNCEACGANVRVCLATPACQVLYPGCGDNPLPAPGCYTRCTGGSGCGDNERCEVRSNDPCAGSLCEACGAQVEVCVPAS